jgi:hypothetical protein
MGEYYFWIHTLSPPPDIELSVPVCVDTMIHIIPTQEKHSATQVVLRIVSAWKRTSPAAAPMGRAVSAADSVPTIRYFRKYIQTADLCGIFKLSRGTPRRETGLEPFALCKTPETQNLERSCELGTSQRCQCRNVSSGKSQRFYAVAWRNVGIDCCAGPIGLGQ